MPPHIGVLHAVHHPPSKAQTRLDEVRTQDGGTTFLGRKVLLLFRAGRLHTSTTMRDIDRSPAARRQPAARPSTGCRCDLTAPAACRPGASIRTTPRASFSWPVSPVSSLISGWPDQRASLWLCNQVVHRSSATVQVFARGMGCVGPRPGSILRPTSPTPPESRPNAQPSEKLEAHRHRTSYPHMPPPASPTSTTATATPL